MTQDERESAMFAGCFLGGGASCAISASIGIFHGEGWGLLAFGGFMLLGCALAVVAAMKGGAK